MQTGILKANAEEKDGKFPFFTCNENPKRINTHAFDSEAILIAGNGNFGHINYYKGKFNAYQWTYVLTRKTDLINMKYAKYFFEAFFKESIKDVIVGGVIPFIKLSNIQNFKITYFNPIIQNCLINLLDKFDDYTKQVTGLLPKDIELRETQYQYYLKKLLEFN
ncbi:restriction endonuclease subunit S [Mycoplasma sp. M5725]|uniref:Restriction endonuclease subunit S n=1 Tax=Mycoplasma phocimorsus TaxID=3045839 RepID=A0AAJ1UX77_9MOLU|nr:restriction endonuclease subunit S [Mycoplasma phocimorsus]MDJ1646075.1 restriction endonuclease subunit S [Mycoplasma phocimorsus]MDJ1646380.1 restriction endonuclease subunit S [Mycoplasma phocimorsus]MDJ1649082.1 restriction endonuclease subunit S [Mycoplasma phocimorsus]